MLCVGTVGLWVRSYHVWDAIDWNGSNGDDDRRSIDIVRRDIILDRKWALCGAILRGYG